MLTTIYYSLAIAAYLIFLIQFIIAVTGGTNLDMDIDLDGDGIGDISWGDIFSFKGFIHFLMGFAGWLSLISVNTGNIAWYDYFIAIAIGIVFVLILFYIGVLLLKLKYEPTGANSENFIGQKGVITIVCNDEPDAYYVTLHGYGSIDLKAYSPNVKHKLGEEVTIQSYENDQFYI